MTDEVEVDVTVKSYNDEDCSLLPYVLVEIHPVDLSLEKSLGRSTRLKYTCFDVSPRYIIFGANSGGIYIHSRRNAVEFMQLIPNHDGFITHLSISPDETHIGFSTKRDIVVILELKQIDGSFKALNRYLSHEHIGVEVTCIAWSDDGKRMYVGDNSGKVSVCYTNSSKAAKLLDMSTANVMKTDSMIVQLDYHKHNLLISNMTKSFLCHTIREQFSVIGTKLRDGEYGACFYPEATKTNFSVFCARPGYRLWEVDSKSTVVHTHQFKQAISSSPSFNVISLRNVEWMKNEELGKQVAPFKRLYLIQTARSLLILAWSNIGIYVFNVRKVTLALWTKDIVGVKELKVYKNHIYMFYDDGTIKKYSFVTLDEALCATYRSENYEICCSLCISFERQISSALSTTGNFNKKIIGILVDIKTRFHDRTKVVDIIEGLLLNYGAVDALSLDSWTSQVSDDMLSCCSLTSHESEPSAYSVCTSPIVIVNQRSSTNKIKDFNYDRELIRNGNLRKASSLPSFDPVLTSDHCYNSTADDIDQEKMTSLSVSEPSHSHPFINKLSDSKPYLSRTFLKNSVPQVTNSTDVKTDDFSINCIDGFRREMDSGLSNQYYYDDEFTIDSFTSEYAKSPDPLYYPIHGLYPGSIHTNVYSDLLESIEFDKLKQKLTEKFSTSKKLLLYNIKELEEKINLGGNYGKTKNVELFDVQKPIQQSGAHQSPSYDSELGPMVRNEVSVNDDVVYDSSRNARIKLNYPTVDVSELLTLTKTTITLLSDGSTVYDSPRLHELLMNWITKLNTCQFELLEKMQSIRRLRDDEQTSSESTDHLVTKERNSNDSTVRLDDINVDDVSQHSWIAEPAFIYDPFDFSDGDHASVSRLAVLCFQVGSVGDIDSFISRYHSLQTTSQPFPVDNMLDLTNNNDVELSSSTDESKKFRARSECCNRCDDCRLSCFVRLYFHLLNFYEVHNTCLEAKYNVETCSIGLYQTWTTLMDSVCHDDVNGITSDCIDTNMSDKSVVAFVKLYTLVAEKNPSSMYASMDDVLLTCLKYKDIINPVYILYLSRRFVDSRVDHERSTTDIITDPYLLFSKFMDAMLQQTLISKVKLFDSPLIRRTWLKRVLSEQYDPVDRLHCSTSCLYPRPDTHRRVWRHQLEIDMVLDMLYDCTIDDYYSGTLQDDATSWCRRYAYWLGYLYCCVKRQQRNEMFKNIVCLGDVSLLVKPDHYPKTDEEWLYIFQLLRRRQQSTFVDDTSIDQPPILCVNCRRTVSDPTRIGQKLTVQSVVKLMLKSMFPDKVIDILRMLDDNLLPSTGQLHPRLYQIMIIKSLINNRQTYLTNRMLKEYDTYLWTKRCQHLPQQIMKVFKQEMKRATNVNDFGNRNPVGVTESTDDDGDSEAVGSASILIQPDCHWGIIDVKSSLSDACPCCNIKLSDQPSSAVAGGITILKCGHAYHTGCTINGYCQRCASVINIINNDKINNNLM